MRSPSQTDPYKKTSFKFMNIILNVQIFRALSALWLSAY